MYSRLSDAEGEINEAQVDLIKKALTKLKERVENIPKDDSFKIEEKSKVIDIVERILVLNKSEFSQDKD